MELLKILYNALKTAIKINFYLLIIIACLTILSCTQNTNVQEVPERSVATPTTNKWHLTVTYQCTGLTEDVTLTAKSGKPYLDDSGCIQIGGAMSEGYMNYTRICGVRSFTFN